MPMQFGVVSLWSLLEACRAGSDEEQRQAAKNAGVAVRDYGTLEGSLTLELVDSLLIVDGFPAVSGVDTFAATHGLFGFLGDASIARVAFAADVAASSLMAWAKHVVATTTPDAWPDGIEVQLRCGAESGEIMAPQPRTKPVIESPDSQLRSVFLQYRLIAGLPAIAGVDVMTAKLVIQGVVDRLLQIDGGLEPLMLLQQDEDLLRRSTAVAVLAVVFARRAGWPVEQLADLGAAALLHDLGSILDAASPGPAAFRWLLERGHEDFWLRSALIARRWRDGLVARTDPAVPLAVITIVRLAVVAYDQGAVGVDAARDAGAVPEGLAELACSVLAAT
ncbi:MAG: hypothetical protein ACI89X_002901 [Planctomycetota bacterium]|jgi:hypothetical protein